MRGKHRPSKKSFKNPGLLIYPRCNNQSILSAPPINQKTFETLRFKPILQPLSNLLPTISNLTYNIISYLFMTAPFNADAK
jgi:hypothetical protein